MLERTSTSSIENGPTPSDSVQVGTTWKYVNKRGGPDRRFKDNRQLPVMQYGRIDLSTPGRLNIPWSFSHVPSAQAFSTALSRLASFRASHEPPYPAIFV